MSKFLLKVVLFIVPLIFVAAAVFLLEDGSSDAFYLRFTTSKQRSLIVGNSRAAQGLIPSILNSRIDSLENPVFNFAFTLSNSAYGPVYYNSILQKLDSSSNKGTFIVTIDPWSLSVIADDPNDANQFPERENFLATLDEFNSSPNLDYLLNHYSSPYYNILFRRWKPSHLKLHEDGWLEVTVKMDQASVDYRTASKVRLYSKNSMRFKFSELRFEYFLRTLNLFRQHGEVYLVRLPIHSGILESERKLMPDFSTRVSAAATELSIPFFDMTADSSQYLYTDGNHLYKESAKEVSVKISEWINAERSRDELLAKKSNN